MTTTGVPVATPESAPFWTGLEQRELRVQRCDDCERYYFYPRPTCRYCGSSRVGWKAVSGRATLLSYVINQRPTPGALGDQAVIALVELAEGPRMMTNIVGLGPEPDPALLELDAAVSVDFENRGGQTVPVFRLGGSVA